MQTILFLDDWMIEQRTCLERVWGKPQFVKEIFSDYYPGFLGYSGWMSVFYDERLGKYALYMQVYPPESDPGAFLIRLQSDDPAHWDNPTYDVSASPPWKGFKDVVLTQEGDKFRPVVRSLSGTPLADRGYVATSYNPDRQVENSVLGFSQDGTHFTVDWDRPWHNTRSDTWNGVLWNEIMGFYQIFTRPVHVDRRVSIVTTTDFQKFSLPQTVLQPDAFDLPGTEFYSMPVRPYEDMYIGFVHLQTPDTVEDRHIKMGGRVETQLTYSYNGVNWYRTLREPFVGVRDYGLPGGGGVYATELLRAPNDRLLIFVEAAQGEHAAYPDMQEKGMDTTGYFRPLLYDMRLDGFCSLKTWGKDGLLRTKTVIPKSGEMSLNVRTTAHTAIRVQVLDGETAEPIPGYTLDEAMPISGDHLFAKPRWQERSGISELVDRPVRIEIAMREAEIFAIRLDCQVFIGKTPTENL